MSVKKRNPPRIFPYLLTNSGSGCHRSLHISYPKAEDGNEAGRNHISAGGDIMIHGISNG